MIPVKLVLAMVAFLEIDIIVVVLDFNRISDNIADVILFLSNSNDHLKLEITDFSTLESSCDFKENTLMLDYMSSYNNFLSKSQNYPASCYVGNIFWLVKKPDIIPINLRFDSNYYTVYDTEHGIFALEEHYLIKGNKFKNEIGHWSEEKGLDILNESKWERRKDLSEIQLDIATTVLTTYVFLLDDGGYGGYLPEVIQAIQAASNFSIKWAAPIDKKFGAPIGNGSWNGVVGMVHRREVDLGAATLAITIERTQVIDYSKTLLESHSTLNIVHPSLNKHTTKINMNAFIDVFTLKSWVCVLLIYCLIALGSFVLYMNKHQKENNTKFALMGTVMKSFCFSYHAILKLSLSDKFPLCSGKIMVVLSGLVSITLMSYFEGTLTSFLTAKQSFKKLISFRDTIEQGYSVVVTDGSKHATDMENALPGTAKHEVYQKLMKNNPKAYYANAIEEMKAAKYNPKYAIYGPALVYQNSGFYALKGLAEAEINYMALAFKKNSDLISFFNHYILKIRQGGILDFLRYKWADGRKPLYEFSNDKVEEATPLGFANTGFLTTVLSTGMAIAPMVLVGEWLHKLWCHQFKVAKEAP